jgi:hypothetical protein
MAALRVLLQTVGCWLLAVSCRLSALFYDDLCVNSILRRTLRGATAATHLANVGSQRQEREASQEGFAQKKCPEAPGSGADQRP